MGSWVTYGLGSESKDLPGFVVLQSGPRGPRGGGVNWGSGFLPSSHQGVGLRPGVGDQAVLHRERAAFHLAQRGVRTVVLEKLVKFNGETHAPVTPAEYTQLTGRAGRRGIDVEGHGVVLWRRGVDPMEVAGLASTRTYPLRSSFRPSSNMAVNLVAQYGRERAHELLQSSFAQFQADRSVVGLARRVRAQEESLQGYQEAMTCHLGDFSEYAALRRELKDLERAEEKAGSRRRRSDAVASLHDLLPGDVVEIPRGRNAGYAVILSTDPNRDDPRPSILTLDHPPVNALSSQLLEELEEAAEPVVPDPFLTGYDWADGVSG